MWLGIRKEYVAVGEEDKSHYHGGCKPKAHREYPSKHIGPVLQDGKGDDDHSKCQRGGIDDGCYVVGVVQSSHFHLAGTEGKKYGSDLHQSF